MADRTKKKQNAYQEPEDQQEPYQQDEGEAQTEGEDDPLAQLQSEVTEYKTKYMRAIADYRNFEQRMMKERAELADRCKRDVLTSFLPIIDNLSKAEMFISDPGLKMIKDQFMQTLEMNGVKEVALEGKPFDPHLAECIETVDGESNVIVEVVRNAYELNGAVIQHGQVKVGRSSQSEATEQSDEDELENAS